MRIRKAEKLLGWAAKYRAARLPQQPSDSAAGFPRELKPSSQEDLEAADETSDIGVIGNGFQPKEKEEEEEDDGKKEELDDKADDKETKAMGVMQCKKTDGKRWHCRHPAKLPHSLCGYHLTQLRSYRARFEDQVSGNHRKKPSFALDCGGATSNYYYYYSVLGPWWGKRRGPIKRGGLNKDSVSESSPQDSNGKSNREDIQEADEKKDGAVSFSEVKYNNNNNNNNNKTKKKRMIKKRGRKPVKSRSLKSLF